MSENKEQKTISDKIGEVLIKDKETQSMAEELLGGKKFETKVTVAQKEMLLECRKKANELFRIGHMSASTHQLLCHIIQLLINNPLPTIRHSNTSYALDIRVARGTVINSLKWLQKRNLISMGAYPGKKGTPRWVKVNPVSSWGIDRLHDETGQF